jgi:hypothetical protein
MPSMITSIWYLRNTPHQANSRMADNSDSQPLFKETVWGGCLHDSVLPRNGASDIPGSVEDGDAVALS